MKEKLKIPKHEFRVAIGVQLPPEAAKRIAQSVQRAVLAELANVDLKGPVAVNFLPNGGTQGIVVHPAGDDE